MWTGLLGLIFGGPVGWLVGGAVGAGVGAVTAKVVDIGIPDEWVAWFREAGQPGTTTVVLLLEDLDIGALANEMTRFPFARLVHTTLPEDAMRRLEAALGEHEPPPRRPAGDAAGAAARVGADGLHAGERRRR